MLDYRGIQALFTVIQEQNFEMAAQKLFITQSAVSQRIKSLETYYGKPVLIRSLPYRPTPLGKQLLGHFKKIMLLEDSLQTELTKEIEFPKIAIAINRDSLDTWFIDVIKQAKPLKQIILEIIADDQEITLDYFKQGLVTACLSTSDKAISGCKVEFLGYMDYVLVASPAFKQRYFKSKQHKVNLLQAPAVIFDNKDYLHQRYLNHFFKIDAEQPNYHIVPSVAGFRQFVISGYGYALIPRIDILPELKTNKLVELFPKEYWPMPLYWHSWELSSSSSYNTFNAAVVALAQQQLRQA